MRKPEGLKIWQLTVEISDSIHVRRVDYGVSGNAFGYLTSKECRTLASWLLKAADYIDEQESGKKKR